MQILKREKLFRLKSFDDSNNIQYQLTEDILSKIEDKKLVESFLSINVFLEFYVK